MIMSQNGVLKDKYVIKSLPRRVLDKVVYGGHQLYEPLHNKNEKSDDDFAYTHHHVIYKLPPSDPQKNFSEFHKYPCDTYAMRIALKFFDLGTHPRTISISSFYFTEIADPVGRRTKRDAPSIIYPEILVVVDYNEYK